MSLIKNLFIKKPTSLTVEPSKQRICSYEELNALYGIDQFLNRISNIAALPPGHFNYFYQTPIRLLCCRLQHIPSLYQHSKNPFLIDKFEQILLGMKYRENFIMPTGVAPEDINLKRDIWRYATFFSLVLTDLGPALTSYSVNVKEGADNLVRWNPFGNIAATGCQVDYSPITPLDNASSLILAPLLFSTTALEWLNQDSAVINSAISAITGNGSDGLVKIIHYALGNKETTNKSDKIELKVAKEKTEDNIALSAREYGNLFVKWFTKSINAGTEALNPLVIVSSDEVAFRVPETFKLFVEEVSCAIDWKGVQNGFKKLNIHKVVDRNDMFNLEDVNGKVFRCIVLKKEHLALNEDKPTPTFFEWLSAGLKKNTISGTKSKPLSFSTKDYLYLVLPNIIDVYAKQFQRDPRIIEKEFLSLELHTKNSTSDYFEFSIDEQSLKTLKIPIANFKKTPA